MKRWSEHPPSPGRIAIMAAVVCMCIAFYMLEQAGMLPDWMEADRMGRGLRRVGF